MRSALAWRISLTLVTGFTLACTKAPATRSSTPKADQGSKDQKVQTGTPPSETPPDPSQSKVIKFAEKGWALGPSTTLSCGPKKSSGILPVGSYVNFEVLDDKTKFTLKLDNFCGDISKANITLYKATNREPVISFPLPDKPIENAELSFESGELSKGQYLVGFEVGGVKLEELSSLGIESGSLTFNKWIKFESISEY